MKYLTLAFLAIAAACQTDKKIPDAALPPASFAEKHRPQFHFSPPVQWMNDPNGMFYYDGEYHLFYQHYPDSNVWGPMHWGHAVSEDMIRWEHLSTALYPDSLGYIFSGSAVVDRDNTSGFGARDNPPIVAVFTYHDPEGDKAERDDFQTQGIAYSTDKGRTWTKHDQNPVLPNPGIKDFRDPKVSWYDPGRKWIMALAVHEHVSFYSSPDLKKWEFESNFGEEWGSHAGVWECPDLFEMALEGTGQKKWALLVSINPGGPLGGSATQYFVGDFDGSKFELADGFVPEVAKKAVGGKEKEQAVWLDQGPDNYAGVTWSDIPPSDGRRLFLGWMSNWQYAQVVPTTEWRSAMTLPRELKLIERSGSYRLHSAPVKETANISNVPAEPDLQKELTDSTYLITVAANGNNVTIQLSNSLHEAVTIRATDSLLSFDRTKSGIVDFHKKFPAEHRAFIGGVEINSMKVFVDLSSIEVFVNDGEVVMTEIVFPREPYRMINLSGDIRQSSITSLRSIWQ